MQDTISETYHQSKNFLWLTALYAALITIPLTIALAIDHIAARCGGVTILSLITTGWGVEMFKQLNLFGAHLEYKRALIARVNAETRRIELDIANAAPQPIRVIRETVTPEGFSQQKIREYPNPPDREFIKWVFDESKLARERRVPGERAIEKSRWGEQGDEWTDILIEQGFIEWVNADSPKLGRRWVHGRTLNESLSRFGHSPTVEESQ